MSRFERYKDAFRTIRLDRSEDGVLEMTFHTEGRSWTWDRAGIARGDLAHACRAIARDPDNSVIIMTGTGNTFCGPAAGPRTPHARVDHHDRTQFVGTHRMLDILDFPGPVISCINGPVLRHPELPFIADIVLAAEDASIADSAHVSNRLVPGDGVAVLFPFLMPGNRGRYFHWTGETLSAHELRDMGLVNEVHPRERLIGRARELAAALVAHDPVVLRSTRRLLTAPLRTLLREHLHRGHTYEGLAAVDEAFAARPVIQRPS